MPINPSLARLCDHRFKPRTVMESPVHVKCAGHPPASYPTSHPLSWLCFLCIITLKIRTLPTVAQSTFTDLQSNFLSFFSCVFSLEHTSGHLSSPQISHPSPLNVMLNPKRIHRKDEERYWCLDSFRTRMVVSKYIQGFYVYNVQRLGEITELFSRKINEMRRA